jgi:enediyne biosynthesis thioesterase
MSLSAPERAHREDQRAWTWRPFIGFEDTNLVGNVYFARFISWQGTCREAFLAEYAPDVLAALAADLRLVTLSVSCEYFEELHAFDPVTLEMKLARQEAQKLTLAFEYWLDGDSSRRLAARGEQRVACMRAIGDRLVPAPLPASLAAALAEYA